VNDSDVIRQVGLVPELPAALVALVILDLLVTHFDVHLQVTQGRVLAGAEVARKSLFR
jgi:hypothetical protein